MRKIDELTRQITASTQYQMNFWKTEGLSNRFYYYLEKTANILNN